MIGTSAHASAAPLLVNAVAPVAAAAAIGQGGKPTPTGGETLPVHAAAAGDEVIRLTAAVDGINRFLRDSQRQMVFQVDLHSGKETVTIVNPATGEVIRQIPSTQVMASARSLQQAGILMPGLFLDERA
jgi:uncharacterized FlaG/YvyC family protein